MKRKGASIIFVNDNRQVLLFLRDNIPSIPYPNMWDVPGGHVEKFESPGQCIVREMKEEMNLILDDFVLFSKIEFDDRIEYTFWAKADFAIAEIELTEGQKLKWFTQEEAKQTQLAYGFNEIVEKFFNQVLIEATMGGKMKKIDRDIEKVYSVKQMVGKLRRLADCLEKGKNFQIQIAGERIFVPSNSIFNIEHEREGNNEEIEFQFKWERS